jgi:hypothetical protein
LSHLVESTFVTVCHCLGNPDSLGTNNVISLMHVKSCQGENGADEG